jgi:hypothetical protein
VVAADWVSWPMATGLSLGPGMSYMADGAEAHRSHGCLGPRTLSIDANRHRTSRLPARAIRCLRADRWKGRGRGTAGAAGVGGNLLLTFLLSSYGQLAFARTPTAHCCKPTFIRTFIAPLDAMHGVVS